MGFILIHFILNIFFPLFQGFEVLLYLLFGQFALLLFRRLVLLILILLFIILLLILLVFFILLFLLILFLFFKKCFYQVLPGFTVIGIQTQGILPGVNAFIQFFLPDHCHAFIVISTLPGILISFGLQYIIIRSCRLFIIIFAVLSISLIEVCIRISR